MIAVAPDVACVIVSPTENVPELYVPVWYDVVAGTRALHVKYTRRGVVVAAPAEYARLVTSKYGVVADIALMFPPLYP
jgi:hypothetical protein